MRSLTTITLVSLLALLGAGCRSGVISVRAADAGAPPPPTTDGGGPSAQEVFSTSVEPMLSSRCGGCHGADRAGPDFLRPDPDVRTTLLGYPALIDLERPSSSRLITKGVHSGPALTAGEITQIEAWIALEAIEGTMVDPREVEYATAPAAITAGFNVLPLDRIGLPGSVLHFVAAPVGDGYFLDGVQIVAGPTGAHLEHPVFMTWIAGVPFADPVDRFAGLDIDVEPNTTQTFDTGTVVLTDFPEGAMLSVHFDAASPLTGGPMREVDGGMPMPTADGCTQLDAFRTSVSDQLGTFCTRCHAGGNPSATSAMDMTRVRSTDDAQLLLGCNQVLGRISAGAPSASGLFVQPDPAAGGTHPFKFGTTRELDTFRTSILGWFEMEAM